MYYKSTDNGLDSIPFLGDTPSIRKLLFMTYQVSRHADSVLVTGEIGTGKELIAKKLHFESPRKNYPFVHFLCTSSFHDQFNNYENKTLREQLVTVDKGTIFFDEISNLNMNMQAQLACFLKERKTKNGNNSKPVYPDVRVIASSSKDLENAVKEGTFRYELYFHLVSISLSIPPLRFRKDDIPLITDYYLKDFSKQMGKDARKISQSTLDMLMYYDWPGNVRELKNVTERAVMLGKTNILYPENFSKDICGEFYPITMKQLEKQNIIAAMKIAEGNKTKAASLLDIGRATLYNKLKELAI